MSARPPLVLLHPLAQYQQHLPIAVATSLAPANDLGCGIAACLYGGVPYPPQPQPMQAPMRPTPRAVVQAAPVLRKTTSASDMWAAHVLMSLPARDAASARPVAA